MKSKDDDGERIAIFLLTGGVIFAVISYLTVAFLCFTASLQLPAVLPTLGGVVRVPWHWQHLSAAFPPEVRRLLPGNAWIPLILLTLMAIAGAAASWLHVDRLKGRRRMALRSYDPRAKVTPRAWARPRDVRHLRKQVTDSWTMLRLDRRRIGTAPETHVLLVAPAGSGKTTGPVTTWTVEHDGPAVVTSTKGDIVNLTAGARLAQGPVWIYAPGVDPRALPLPACGWTPLAGCEDWEFAQLMAGWLAADAIGGNNVQESDGHAGLTFLFEVIDGQGAATGYVIKLPPKGVRRHGNTDGLGAEIEVGPARHLLEVRPRQQRTADPRTLNAGTGRRVRWRKRGGAVVVVY